MGWTSPACSRCWAAGVVSLIAFVVIERRAQDPMFKLPLLRIRAFSSARSRPSSPRSRAAA
jgi:hypothetical protein